MHLEEMYARASLEVDLSNNDAPVPCDQGPLDVEVYQQGDSFARDYAPSKRATGHSWLINRSLPLTKWNGQGIARHCAICLILQDSPTT